MDESSDFVNKRTGDVAPAGCSYNNVPCLCDMCIKKHIYIYIYYEYMYTSFHFNFLHKLLILLYFELVAKKGFY